MNASLLGQNPTQDFYTILRETKGENKLKRLTKSLLTILTVLLLCSCASKKHQAEEQNESTFIPSSEKETINLFEERGFDFTESYYNSEDGTSHYLLKVTNDTHTKYTLNFLSEDEVWIIYVYGKAVIAYPSRFNANSDEEKPFYLSEIINKQESANYAEEYKLYDEALSYAKVAYVEQISADFLSHVNLEELQFEDYK